MAIIEMKRLSLIGLSSDKRGLLHLMAKLGVVDVQDENGLLAEKQLRDTGEMEALRDTVSDLVIRQTRLAEAIKLASDLLHIKKPLFSKRRPVDVKTLLQVEDRKDEIWQHLLDLEANMAQQDAHKEEISVLRARLQALEPWKDLVLPLKKEGKSDLVSLVFGTLANEAALEALHERLRDADIPYALEILKQSNTGIGLVFLFLNEDFIRAERLLKLEQFSSFPNTEGDLREGDLAGMYQQSMAKVEALQQTIVRLEEASLELALFKDDFELLHDFYQVTVNELRTVEKLLDYEHLFFLKAYVPAKIATEAVDALKEQFAIATTIETPKEGEAFPIQLKNHFLAEPYENVIETFSLPKAGVDPDPTTVMGIFYAMSFGLMLGDVGYGLLLSFICALLIWKFKVEGNMRKMSLMLFQGGLVSIVFGFLFGGFFGNAISEISGGTVHFPTLWFNPMDDPMRMMIWSVIFGLLHIFGGMGLDIYKKVQLGETYEAIFTVAPWYPILIGLGLMMLGIPWARWLAIIPAVVVLLFSSKSFNPFKRIASGLGGLYNIAGYFSDLLSYTRILALALCTSVIAMVVNMMAMLPGIKGIGFIFFLTIMALGHALNLALSGLSAYVHTTRLQYVEFFAKFYEGGGVAYAPLKLDTKYTKPVGDFV